MMSPRERLRYCLACFEASEPRPASELRYDSPFQFLVAVVLSAQCTDRRINQISPALFTRYPSAHAMAEATAEELYPYLQTVSYPHAKADYLSRLSKLLAARHGGEVPPDPALLQELPGVGRKSAHVVCAQLFDMPTIGVDTHVMRVSHRIGLVPDAARTPLAIERALMRHVPLSHASRLNHWLVLHGRYICKAARPLCESCPLQQACRFFQTQKKPSQVEQTGGESIPGI